MIPIQAGEFLMGSQDDEADRDAERPQHPVRLQQFHLSKTPITQAQWRAVAALPPSQGQNWERNLSPNPSEFGDQHNSDKRPVENISWYDAIEFCKRLRRLTGKSYSLPSEAQWEYACRAGTTTAYSFGHEFAQSHANIRTKETTPVRLFPANIWGLHDMHGNVWEWCADHWHDNYTDAPENGIPWIDPYADDELNRLVRGGSWKDDTTSRCRSAIRDYWRADYIAANVGFRICFSPGFTT
jgi:formylglycine-generating enzyme required for sulfatase activity